MLALYLQMPSVRLFFVLVMFVTYFLSDMSCLDDYNNLVFFSQPLSLFVFPTSEVPSNGGSRSAPR